MISIAIGALGIVTKTLIRHWNKRARGDYTNYSIVEIGQNTKKSPSDLNRLAVIHIPAEDHQLTVVWKILREQEK